MEALVKKDVEPLIKYWEYLWGTEFDHWCDSSDVDSTEVNDHNEIEEKLAVTSKTIDIELVEKIIDNCEGMIEDVIYYSYGDVKRKDLDPKKLTPFKKMVARAKKS